MLGDSNQNKKSSDDIVYAEQHTTESSVENVIGSMVYGSREVQIALVRGDIDDPKTRRDFEDLIKRSEF